MTALKSALFATALGATVLLGTVVAATAHDTRAVDRAQVRQLMDIEDGRRSGAITRREHRELLAEQARIADLKRRAEADGRVTGREVRAIREAQREARGHIVAESSDRQVNWWRRWKARHGL